METDGLKLDYLAPGKSQKKTARHFNPILHPKEGPDDGDIHRALVGETVERNEEDAVPSSNDDVERRPVEPSTLTININQLSPPIKVKVHSVQDLMSPSYSDVVELVKRVASDSWWHVGTAYDDLYTTPAASFVAYSKSSSATTAFISQI